VFIAIGEYASPVPLRKQVQANTVNRPLSEMKTQLDRGRSLRRSYFEAAILPVRHAGIRPNFERVFFLRKHSGREPTKDDKENEDNQDSSSSHVGNSNTCVIVSPSAFGA